MCKMLLMRDTYLKIIIKRFTESVIVDYVAEKLWKLNRSSVEKKDVSVEIQPLES